MRKNGLAVCGAEEKKPGQQSAEQNKLAAMPVEKLQVSLLAPAIAARLGFGGALRASIAMGKGDNEKAESILWSCVFTLTVLAAGRTGV